MTAPAVERASTVLEDLAGDLCLEDSVDVYLWPPDVFALTSETLKVTGAYRLATDATIENPWPPKENWVRAARRQGREWWKFVYDFGIERNEAPAVEDLEQNLASVGELRTKLIEYRDLPIDAFDAIGSPEAGGEERKAAEEVAVALLTLHGLADEACAGFGVLSGARGMASIIHFAANSLLSETGSLARRTRSRGLVLPKMRTSQVGLTLRSFSHHLTFHQTESQVTWRAVPWTSEDETTLNILMVPFPYRVSARAFQPRPTLGQARSIRNGRFFEYSEHGEALDVDEVLDLVRVSEAHAGRVHVILLPELSIGRQKLLELQDKLVQARGNLPIPMILAGIADRGEGRDAAARNRVVLCTYFAGKWYELAQDKHHRWKLDAPQVLQYGLGGVLTGGRDWWEAISIPNRCLSMLVPSGWLALAPLICEDLARLDPISELIRGIGPTLTIALLFDGPQLKERWPARYASVLADDPGSSVLTFTNLGMARRSRIWKDDSLKTRSSLGNRTVALWKDDVRGWHTVTLPPNCRASLLTVTAEWDEEYTADGRSDGRHAARFVLQGVHPIYPSREREALDGRCDEGAWDVCSLPDREDVSESTKQPLPKFYGHASGADLLELSSVTYLADSLLDCRSEDVIRIANLARYKRQGDSPLLASVHGVLCRRSSLRNGQDAEGDDDQLDQYRFTTRRLRRRIDIAERPPTGERIAQIRSKERRQYYSCLVRHCAETLDCFSDTECSLEEVLGELEIGRQRELSPITCLRLEMLVVHTVLWTVHKRVSEFRRQGRLSSLWADLLCRTEDELQREGLRLLDRFHGEKWPDSDA
ncbi:MAG: hypothetical protein DWQ30_03430 [Acidobacteria bacterium]|nr:MAG: hypothetical protein DWQ30_03430 [Acidobacteriota bacterium]